jgi:hypothetical protein
VVRRQLELIQNFAIVLGQEVHHPTVVDEFRHVFFDYNKIEMVDPVGFPGNLELPLEIDGFSLRQGYLLVRQIDEPCPASVPSRLVPP